MNAYERKQLLSTFPFDEIQLSYETHVHKKVQGSHISMAIPDGIKSYAWITSDGDVNVCWIMEIGRGAIANITRLSTEFNVKLSYGTIFYGTTFKRRDGLQKQQGQQQGQQCFSIEDVLFFKGKNVCRTSYLSKLELLRDTFNRNGLQHPDILFGLPVMDEQFYPILNNVETLPYKSSFIHFRYLEGTLTNTTFIMKYMKPHTAMQTQSQTQTQGQQGQQQVQTQGQTQGHQQGQQRQRQNTRTTIISVVADIQPDVYHMTAPDGTTSVACISSYNVSVMMNAIFRNIKENVRLDALEESDDETEFEDVRDDKFLVVKTTPVKMRCEYNHKFRKWIPVGVC